jgi:hypothetical protein
MGHGVVAKERKSSRTHTEFFSPSLLDEHYTLKHFVTLFKLLYFLVISQKESLLFGKVKIL